MGSQLCDEQDVGLADRADMFQYFLKVVSTSFVTLKGHTISTHQYSVTQYERDLSGGNKPGPDELGHQNQHGYAGVPGVFVNYEVRRERNERPS